MTDKAIPFTIKYRPAKEKNLIGQEQRALASSLIKLVENGGRITPRLFFGPSGIGKTSIAKMVANKISETGEHVEIIHHNCSELSGVADSRRLLPVLRTHSIYGGKKVIILDEVHSLSAEAQSAFLIPLEGENLPEDVIILAATTSLDKLLPTFVSRFMVHTLNIPSNKELNRLVTAIVRLENIELDDEDRISLVNSAAGNVRTLVHNLEQISSGTFALLDVEKEEAINFINALKRNDISSLLSIKGDYNSLLIRACYYAIKVLTTKPADTWARKVLLMFGGGLSKRVPEKVAFSKLMIEYVSLDNK